MSLLIDTNVISELICKFPNPDVKKWVADQPAETLFISTVSEAELLYGAEILPAGKRREKLISNIENLIRDAFGGRVLPFDRLAARQYAIIAAKRHYSGYSVTPADCQIAAIARSQGMIVATRNVRDFLETGIEVVNPWLIE